MSDKEIAPQVAVDAFQFGRGEERARWLAEVEKMVAEAEKLGNRHEENALEELRERMTK